jgi:hypothetical protein
VRETQSCLVESHRGLHSMDGASGGKQRADPDLTVGASIRNWMTDFDLKASDETGRIWPCIETGPSLPPFHPPPPLLLDSPLCIFSILM